MKHAAEVSVRLGQSFLLLSLLSAAPTQAADSAILNSICFEAAKAARVAALQRMRGVSEDRVSIERRPEVSDETYTFGISAAYRFSGLSAYPLMDVTFKYCMVLGHSDSINFKADSERVQQLAYSARHCLSKGTRARTEYEECMSEINPASRATLEGERGYVVPD